MESLLPGQYKNLNSKRIVKHQPKDETICWGIAGHSVIGTREQIEYYTSEKQICDPEYIKPFQNVRILCNDAVEISKAAVISDYAISGAGENIETDDIEMHGKYEVFGFDNLDTQARVLKVIDADTWDIHIYIKLTDLARKRNNGEFSVIVPDTHAYAGFFTKVRVRLYGLDSAEKNTQAGKRAKELMVQKLESLNYTVYVRFLDACNDKYGRSLVVINSIDGELLNNLFEHDPELASSYTGGTKTLPQTD